MQIREANIGDVKAILGLMRLMHSESTTFNSFNFDEEKASYIVKKLLEADADNVFFMVVENDGELVAMMSGEVGDDLWTASKQAFDYGLYVVPLHRGRATGYWLLQRFLNWAEARADYVKISANADIDNEMAAKLFEGSGLTRSGYIYGKVF